MTGDIAVLVVEDDPVTCQAHVAYVNRVGGFRAVAAATDAATAIRRLGSAEPPPIDLVLLDMNLPDRHGLDILRALRAARHPADVIAVTSARELATVKAAVSAGVVQYVLKPFSFATLRDRLQRYADYRRSLDEHPQAGDQGEVDQLLDRLRAPGAGAPSGLLAQTVSASLAALRDRGRLSAPELADILGTSRVTARRYLEHLVQIGAAGRDHRYQGAGRPVVEYRLRS